MTGWGGAEQKAGKFLKELDADDLHDQLNSMRAYLKDLTGAFGKIANRQWGHARERASDTAQEAEDLMKDNLAASLIVALGVGVLVGYMIRRSSE
jgi:ElaB/YqjD/DUF883 family membrane-anchored ribosome-binding protein